MNEADTVYPSRVDWWMALILVAIPLTPVGIGVCLVAVSWVVGLGCVVFGFLVGALVLRMTFPCRYILTDNALIVQCGWDEQRIPLRCVREVHSSRSIMSAPALSLRRVEIVFDGGRMIVSPRDREGFIADIMSRLPAA